MSSQNRPAFDTAFWFQWIMATSLGWLLGSLVFPNLSSVSAGVGVGVLQWPVLYRRFPQAWRWPLVTAIAWIAGYVLIFVAVPDDLHLLFSGLLLGLIVGLGQWLILRREVRWAGWWLVITPIAWITGLPLIEMKDHLTILGRLSAFLMRIDAVQEDAKALDRTIEEFMEQYA